MNWEGPGEMVPEKPLLHARLSRSGYGLSKLAASKVLDYAAKHWQVNSTTVRICQLAGPVERGSKGAWPRHEWLPSMIASSKFLGLIPESLGPMNQIDWIPVDIAAKIVAEIAVQSLMCARRSTADVMHVASPRLTNWQAILPTIQDRLGPEVRRVPLSEWVAALSKEYNHADAGRHGASLSLLDFFSEISSGLEQNRPGITLDTTCTQQASPSLAAVPAVEPEWMNLWLSQWGF